MFKLRWLVIGLVAGGAIMLAASLLVTEKQTDHPSAAEKRKSQSSALLAPGAGDSINSTGLLSSATSVPKSNMAPYSSVEAQGIRQAGALGPEDSLPGHNIATSSASGVSRKQPEQNAFSEALVDPPKSELISTASSPRNLELAVTVPPGEQAPAVFYDNEPRTEPQMLIMDEIARDFNEAIQREVPGYTAEEVWSEARDWADERYVLFFGEEAWNKLHLQAALEAVAEKEAMGQLPQRTYE